MNASIDHFAGSPWEKCALSLNRADRRVTSGSFAETLNRDSDAVRTVGSTREFLHEEQYRARLGHVSGINDQRNHGYHPP